MLSLLSKVYGPIIAVRNYLYDKGVLEVYGLGAPTISVGNLTAGGTGKTPLVAHIASILADRGEKVCILTRGYGRDDEGRRVLVSDGASVLADAVRGGDEPVELARQLLGRSIVVADADRVAAAEWARRRFAATVFVLDDAFQHRRAKRNIDIVCVDATDPFGGSRLLPAGRLREPSKALQRADAVVVTRAELARDLVGLRSEISDLHASVEIFEARTELTSVATPSGESLDPTRRVFAFCGLGNPRSFFSLIDGDRYKVAGAHAFPDHHVYDQRDILELEAEAFSAGADALVTTAKDAVKLSDLEFKLQYYVAQIKLAMDREEAFEAMLSRVCSST